MRNLVVNIVCVCLFLTQTGFSNVTDCKEARSCRELLECVGSPATTLPSAPPSSPTQLKAPAVVNLSEKSKAELITLASTLKKSEIALIPPDLVSDREVRDSLIKSEALFAMAPSSVTDDRIQRQLSAPIGRPRVLAAVPLDEEGVTALFGRGTSSPRAVTYFAKLARSYKSLQNSRLLASSSSAPLADEVEKELSSARELVILVAHSDRGRLWFPDGSSLLLADLSSAQGRSGRDLLVLGCDTIESIDRPTDLALTLKRLNFDNIANALSALQQQIEARDVASFGDALISLQNSVVSGKSAQQRTQTAVMMTGGGFIIMASLFFWQCVLEDKCESHEK